MFKKRTTTEASECRNGSRTVVTETVETTTVEGGVRTTKRTVTTGGDFESAFKSLGFDSGGGSSTFVTKKVSSSSVAEPQRTEFVEKKKEKSSKGKEAENSKKPAPPCTVKPGKFEELALKSHNDYRALHGVPKLKLSKQLCQYSKEWADHLAATDKFQHRGQRQYGENIFMKWSSDPSHVVSGSDAVDSWYSEIKDHKFGTESFNSKTGHFTQVVWKESKELGIAWSRSNSGKILVVANYDPAGNFMGKFAENVPPPKAKR